MKKCIKNANLIVTEKSYKLLSDVEIDNVIELNEKVSIMKNLIEDLHSDLVTFDIAILNDLNVFIGLDELSDYLDEYLNDRENYEKHVEDDEEDNEDDKNDEYNSVGELICEL